MRLGDLDELLKVMDAFEPIVQGRHDGMGLVEHGTWAGLCEIVKDAPTIDAVPVVRCKDCKHWNKGDFMGGDTPDSMEYGGGCPLVRFARYESDFCSKGERKDGAGNG